jgi:hypothetical protein
LTESSPPEALAVGEEQAVASESARPASLRPTPVRIPSLVPGPYPATMPMNPSGPFSCLSWE